MGAMSASLRHSSSSALAWRRHRRSSSNALAVRGTCDLSSNVHWHRSRSPETAEHVSCHIEWASPKDLRDAGIDPSVRRWAVYVRNGGDYPAYKILVALRSNN